MGEFPDVLRHVLLPWEDQKSFSFPKLFLKVLEIKTPISRGTVRH